MAILYETWAGGGLLLEWYLYRLDALTFLQKVTTLTQEKTTDEVGFYTTSKLRCSTGAVTDALCLIS